MSVARNLTFFANGANLALTALKEFTPTATAEDLDATVIGKASREYEMGFKSGTVSASGKWDADAVTEAEIHDILSSTFTTGTSLTVSASMGASGSRGILLQAIETQWDIKCPTGQLIMTNAQLKADGGIEFGWMLVGKQLNSGTYNGPTCDDGAGSTNGGIFHAHLVNKASGGASGVSVKVQHSTNGTVWVDLATLSLSGANDFDTYTVAPLTTVNRYLRGVAVVTGGDTVSVAAAFARR